MTSTVVDPFRRPARRPPQWIIQVLVAQAAIAGVLAAIGQGPLLVTAACAGGATVLVVAFARIRGRWLFTWLALAAGYATRRHSLPPHATPAELFRFLAPDVAETDEGYFEDADGLVAVFELDDPVAATPTPLPDLTGLLDRTANRPHITLDLLVSVARAPTVRRSDPAPGAGSRPGGSRGRSHSAATTPDRRPPTADVPAGHGLLDRLAVPPADRWHPDGRAGGPAGRSQRHPTTGAPDHLGQYDRPSTPPVGPGQPNRPTTGPVGHSRRDHPAGAALGHGQPDRPTTPSLAHRHRDRPDGGPGGWAHPGTADPGVAMASYRWPSGDRVPALRRTFVVLRVARPAGWSDADLWPAMSGVARRVAKRIGPHQRLDRGTALTTVAELAHHDGRFAVEDRWAFVAVGGLVQATYRLATANVPSAQDDPEGRARIVQRLLGLPALATTIAISAGPDGESRPNARSDPGTAGLAWLPPGASIAIRLAAETPDQLARADHALRQVAAAERARLQRLDGAHRVAMVDTLPFGGHSRALGLLPGRPDAVGRPRGAGGQRARPVQSGQTPERPTDLAPPSRPRPSPRPRPRRGPPPQQVADTASAPPEGAVLPAAGIVLGYDRHWSAVVVRLFRPAGTRIVVVGGIRAAQTIALHGLALGARIDVRTRRWAAWNSFAEEVGGGDITVTPDAAPMRHWATASAGTMASTAGAEASTVGRTAASSVDTTALPDRATPGAASADSTPAAKAGPFHPILTILDPAARASSGPTNAPTANAEPTPAATVRPGSAAGGGSAPPRGGSVLRRRQTRRHVLELDQPGQDTTDTIDAENRPNTAPANPPRARWHTVLIVRDELTEEDAAVLAQADLVLLQALQPDDDAAAALNQTDHALSWIKTAADGTLRWTVLATDPVGHGTTPNGIDALHPVTRHGNSPRGGD